MQFISLLQPDLDFVLHSADQLVMTQLYFSPVHSTLVWYIATRSIIMCRMFCMSAFKCHVATVTWWSFRIDIWLKRATRHLGSTPFRPFGHLVATWQSELLFECGARSVSCYKINGWGDTDVEFLVQWFAFQQSFVLVSRRWWLWRYQSTGCQSVENVPNEFLK